MYTVFVILRSYSLNAELKEGTPGEADARKLLVVKVLLFDW